MAYTLVVGEDGSLTLVSAAFIANDTDVDGDTVTVTARANDTDPEGDAITVESAGAGAHGITVVNPDGDHRLNADDFLFA